MTARRTLEFVGIKKFYRIDEIAERACAMKKDIIEVAITSGALYKIGSIVLINKEKIDVFCAKMKLYNLDARALYMGPNEVAAQLGLPMDFVHKVASRAKALYRIDGRFFINVELLNNYFAGFKVNYGNDFQEIYDALGIKEDKENV